MIRQPPRSTRVRSSAASDVYKRQRPDDALCHGRDESDGRVTWIENLESIGDGIFRQRLARIRAKSAGRKGWGRPGSDHYRHVEARNRPREPSHQSVRNPLTRAVSYTHLRAHETVLDLVCRLLLEKKK